MMRCGLTTHAQRCRTSITDCWWATSFSGANLGGSRCNGGGIDSSEQAVILRQQPNELLPRTPEMLDMQVSSVQGFIQMTFISALLC